MKHFFNFALFAFCCLPLVPLVAVLDKVGPITPFLNKTMPLYLTIGVIGMVFSGIMADKYENKACN